jgi:hypothetical protein
VVLHINEMPRLDLGMTLGGVTRSGVTKGGVIPWT